MSMIMHLALGKPGQSAGAYPHYRIERPCRILVIGSQLKAKTKYQALLRHVSIGGAMLERRNPPAKAFLSGDRRLQGGDRLGRSVSQRL
ncbi:hypothetical protein [Sinorhizobium fredii]|uniref:hypothetical protein n=1 Tax=Rhizobium fredii TaxID=380 RepID=UPI001FCB5C94|nr:hypothetical protein [Sinorhizobium fredii]WOS63736.1 hypothetical protein SFGR64A_04945 [Sinorhizobium fredii GR64]